MAKAEEASLVAADEAEAMVKVKEEKGQQLRPTQRQREKKQDWPSKRNQRRRQKKLV